MKKNTIIIQYILVCLCLALLLSCGDSRPQPPQQAQRAAQISEPSIVWPPPLDGAETVDAQHILDKNYYILLDTSGSMKGDRLATAKIALQQFVQAIPQEANVGFGILGGNISELVSLGKNNREAIIQSVKQLIASGGTPLGAAIRDVGIEKLSEQARQQLGYGEYTLVILTDGEASDQNLMINVVDALLQDTSIILYTIGFHIDESHSLNQPGRTVYRTANDLDSLTMALGGVLAESPEFDISEF